MRKKSDLKSSIGKTGEQQAHDLASLYGTLTDLYDAIQRDEQAKTQEQRVRELINTAQQQVRPIIKQEVGGEPITKELFCEEIARAKKGAA